MNFDPAIMAEIRAQENLRGWKRLASSRDFDYEIEKANLKGSEDPNWIRSVLYDLKYPEGK